MNSDTGLWKMDGRHEGDHDDERVLGAPLNLFDNLREVVPRF
jgi:hypothetical protein